MTPKITVEVLDALRVEHDKRHGRFESQVTEGLSAIHSRLDKGGDAFNKLGNQITTLTTTCNQRASCQSQNGSRKRDIVVRVGIPATGILSLKVTLYPSCSYDM